MKRSVLSLVVPAAFAAMATVAADEMAATAKQAAFFEARIQPVLAQRCYSCHSANAPEVKGGLRLDTRAGVRKGGASGPAVVPGDLMASLLVSAIRWHDAERGMPPEAKGGRLPDNVIADFERWILMGAPDPRDKPRQARIRAAGTAAGPGSPLPRMQTPAR